MINKSHLLSANVEYGTREKEINALIFHCNIFSLEELIKVYQDEQVSTHYYIDQEGKITCLVEEKNKAYHAGRGSWRGEDKMNDRSIGIELQNKTLGQTPYSKAQIDALTDLSLDIIKRYNIAPTNIIGHSDSAPERKPDPGMSFPWQELAQRDIGLFPKFKEQAPKREKALADLLKEIGYMTENDAQVKASAYAFCRRFTPEFVTPEENIRTLIEHPLNSNFSFMESSKFLSAVEQTATLYKQKSIISAKEIMP